MPESPRNDQSKNEDEGNEGNEADDLRAAAGRKT